MTKRTTGAFDDHDQEALASVSDPQRAERAALVEADQRGITLSTTAPLSNGSRVNRMVTVQCWTGAEAKALRQAMRLSIRAFAAYLGIDARTVNKWEARCGTITLRPDTQALMDTALERALEEVKTRFTQTAHSAKQEQRGNAAQFVAPAHDFHTEAAPGAGSLAPPPENDDTDSLFTEFVHHPLAHAAATSAATIASSPAP